MFDFLKDFQNMRLGDPMAMAPKGEGGWQTAVQKEGSMVSQTPRGAFAGLNPKVSDVGRAMQGAAAQMPGGPPMRPSLNEPDENGWNGRGFSGEDAVRNLGRILSTSPPPGWKGTMDEWRSGKSPGQGSATSQQPQQAGAFSSPSQPQAIPGAGSWLAPFLGQ